MSNVTDSEFERAMNVYHKLQEKIDMSELEVFLNVLAVGVAIDIHKLGESFTTQDVKKLINKWFVDNTTANIIVTKLCTKEKPELYTTVKDTIAGYA